MVLLISVSPDDHTTKTAPCHGNYSCRISELNWGTEDSGPLVRPMWAPANENVHSREAEILPVLKRMPSPPPNSNYLAGP